MTLCIIINSVMALLFMVVVASLVLTIRTDRKNERAEAIIRQAECHDHHEKVIDKVVAAFKTLGHSLDLNTMAMGKRDASGLVSDKALDENTAAVDRSTDNRK